MFSERYCYGAEEAMETIGKYLKDAREAKDLSIDDVSEATRIKVAFLECIEKDDFSPIGGFGYAKVMLATYAKSIGANVEKVMALFEQYYDSDDFEMKPLHLKSREQKKLLLPGNIFSILFLIVVVVVLTVVVVNLYKKGLLDFSMGKQLEKSPTEQVEPEPKPEPVNEEPEPTVTSHPEPVREQQIVIDRDALRDTVDYVDRILFEGEESAFNYKEQ